MLRPSTFVVGPYDQYIGELWPGATGWLPLDDNGTPNGPATIAPPPIGTKAAAVFANYAPNPDANLMVTLAGAPLTDRMNASVDRRFNPVYTS
jgi:hypothetical protein